MKRLLLATCILTCAFAEARTISVDTVCCDDGVTVTVPVKVDDVSDVALASLSVAYDPTIVAFLGAQCGELSSPDDFCYATDDGGSVFLIAPRFVNGEGGGELCKLRFHVRTGTSGQFSDITISDARFCAKDGVRDLSVENPINVVNGMVRVMPGDAQVKRLEGAFVVWPESAFNELVLATGDRIKAADNRNAIRVESVTGLSTIDVEPPLNGWRNGSYSLLTTRTEGLSFVLAGMEDANIRQEQSGGYITYIADVSIEGEIPVEVESGDLTEDVVAQIRTSLADEIAAHPEVESVSVKGDAEIIPVVADLGILPQVDITGTEMTATYSTPTLSIISFNPDTGLVRIKVTPGEGNAIRTVMATGCIHVYGTSSLGEKMRYMSGTTFDLTPYLKDGTKGEADLTVALGSHTFIKVKAETIIKAEGDFE